MKIYLSLIFGAVILAFASGYYTLSMQSSYVATPDDILKISQIKQQFIQNNRPLRIMDVGEIYGAFEQSELIRPLNPLQKQSVTDAQIDYTADKECYKELPNLMSGQNFAKTVIWEDYRCHKRSFLPPMFYTSPPYLHPSGHSYALLSLKRNNLQPKWVFQYLPYFHISELKKLVTTVGSLPQPFSTLADIADEDVAFLSSGEDFILTRDYVFFKRKGIFRFYNINYFVYQREQLEDYLIDTPFNVKKYIRGKQCFYRDGNICWNYSVGHVMALTSTTSKILFVLSLGMIVVVIGVIYQKMRTDRKEEQRKRLALQVLTHEFRTPIASLLLQVEKMSNHIKRFSDDDQEQILRMASDIYRLHRLSELSRNYLKAARGNKLLNLNIESIPSVNQFFQQCLESHGKDVTLRPLVNDVPLKIDVYWFTICIKNLIENALAHGRVPVTVTLSSRDLKNEGWLDITVMDHGDCDFNTLEEMQQEFVKGKKSDGTGLGLNIVSKVIKNMGGTLEFKAKPTRFIISVKRTDQYGKNSAS